MKQSTLGVDLFIYQHFKSKPEQNRNILAPQKTIKYKWCQTMISGLLTPQSDQKAGGNLAK